MAIPRRPRDILRAMAVTMLAVAFAAQVTVTAGTCLPSSDMCVAVGDTADLQGGKLLQLDSSMRRPSSKPDSTKISVASNHSGKVPSRFSTLAAKTAELKHVVKKNGTQVSFGSKGSHVTQTDGPMVSALLHEGPKTAPANHTEGSRKSGHNESAKGFKHTAKNKQLLSTAPNASAASKSSKKVNSKQHKQEGSSLEGGKVAADSKPGEKESSKTNSTVKAQVAKKAQPKLKTASKELAGASKSKLKSGEKDGDASSKRFTAMKTDGQRTEPSANKSVGNHSKTLRSNTTAANSKAAVASKLGAVASKLASAAKGKKLKELLASKKAQAGKLKAGSKGKSPSKKGQAGELNAKAHLVSKKGHAGKVKAGKVEAEAVKAGKAIQKAKSQLASKAAKRKAAAHKSKRRHKKADEEEEEEDAHTGTLFNPVIGSVIVLMSAPAGLLLLAFGAFLWVKSQEDVEMGA